MLEKLFSKRHSIIFTWLFSYILVLVVPVAIAGITYVETVRVVENEINNSNSLFLKRIQQQMDSLLNDAERLSEEVALNSRVNALLRETGPFDNNFYYNLYLTTRDLGAFRIPNASIDDFYIYFKNIDFVVSSSTSKDSSSFYDAYIKPSGMSYEEWLKIASGYYRGNYITVNKSNPLRKNNKAVVFIKSIPFLNQGNSIANIFIILDESRFMNEAGDIESFDKGNVLILDNENRVMASSNADRGVQSVKYSDLDGDEGLMHRKLEGKQYVISHTTSQVSNWKFVAFVPYSIFWEKAYYIRRLTFGSLIFCILIGGFITYFSLKKNYNPVLNLIKLLEKNQGLNFGRNNNEYKFIEQVIDKVQSDKERVDIILKQQNRQLKSELLTRLVKGRLGSNLPVADALALHDISFKSEYFAVMVFYIEDFYEIFPEAMQNYNEENSFEKFKMVQFIITNVVEEMIGQKNNLGFLTDIDDMLVCIINFDREEVVNAKAEMSRLADESKVFLNKHFNINYLVAISDVHNTVAGIPEAYSEALQALEYKKVLGIDEITHYVDIIGLPKGNYYYPLEVEQQLINCIKAGDNKKAKSILDDIFQKNFEGSILSVKIARCLMFNLVSTMIKTINETSYAGNNDFVEDLNPIERLLNCESIIEMKQEMIKILDIFCNYIKLKSKTKNRNTDQQLVENVISYVQTNYSDINLGVSSIAEYYNVHLVHLSRVFKEVTGEGLLDYINQVRIKKAKTLFNEPSSLDFVAKAVGYSNIRTFSRVFKKYEGITPGKFKDIN